MKINDGVYDLTNDVSLPLTVEIWHQGGSRGRKYLPRCEWGTSSWRQSRIETRELRTRLGRKEIRLLLK